MEGSLHAGGSCRRDMQAAPNGCGRTEGWHRAVADVNKVPDQAGDGGLPRWCRGCHRYGQHGTYSGWRVDV